MYGFRASISRLSSTAAATLVLMAPLASGAPLAYVATSSNQFGVIDLRTGNYTHRGNTPEVIIGLGINDGTLYGIDALDRLVTINPQAGETTVVGPTGIPGSDPNANIGAVPYFTSLTSGELFAFDWSNNLYSINAATGAGTFIGATGIPKRSGPFGSIAAGGSEDALYYLIEEVLAPGIQPPVIPGSLYRIDPGTGEAVLVTDALPARPFLGAGFADDSFYAFRASLGGVLPPAEIWRIDPSTGAVVSIINQDPALGDVFAAVQAPVPEPGTLWLLAGGLMVVTWRLRRRHD